MDPLISAIAENLFFTLIMAGGVIWIIAATIDSVLKNSARERTRREIAAYVAEGSMSAEEGERLIKAGKDAE